MFHAMDDPLIPPAVYPILIYCQSQSICGVLLTGSMSASSIGKLDARKVNSQGQLPRSTPKVNSQGIIVDAMTLVVN
jgi:hypothetical protein